MKSNDRIRIEYVFGENYSPEYINGAYGGKNTKGEIIVNFYCERNPVPKEEEYEFNNNGTVERKSGDDTELLPIVRDIRHGIIMNKDTAREIHSWLGKILEG